jgi:protein-tyrosine phosphatase
MTIFGRKWLPLSFYCAFHRCLDLLIIGDHRICWEQDVPVIVMLTREVESSLIKCGKYWNDGRYGDITLKLLKQDGREEVAKAKPGDFFATTPKVDSADTIIERIFQITNKAQPDVPAKRIIHFQYIGWPDQDVPKSPAELLKLIKRVNLVTNGHPSGGSRGPGPILLHCSAGVGRTGGFILVDSILAGIRHEMERKGTFPMQGILDDTSESEEMDVDVDDLDVDLDEDVDVPESVFTQGLRSGSNISFSPSSSLSGGPSQSGSDAAPMLNTSSSSLSSTPASSSVPSVRASRGFESPRVGVNNSNGGSRRSSTSFAAPKPQKLSQVIAEKLIKESKAPLHTPAQITEWSMQLPHQTQAAFNSGRIPVATEGENVILSMKDSPPDEKPEGLNYKLPRELDALRGSPPFPSDFREPVREVLEDMREQRMSLCQSLRQYVFAHRAIIEGTLDLVDEAKMQRMAFRTQPQSRARSLIRPQSKSQSRTQFASLSHSHSRSLSNPQAQMQMQSHPQAISFSRPHTSSRGKERAGDMNGAFMAWSSTSSLSSTSGLAPLSSSPSRMKAGRLSSSEDKAPRGLGSNDSPMAVAMASSPPPVPKQMTGKRSASPPTSRLDVVNLKLGKSPSLKKKHRSGENEKDIMVEDFARMSGASLGHSAPSSQSSFGISNISRSSGSSTAGGTGSTASTGMIVTLPSQVGSGQPRTLGHSKQPSHDRNRG